MYYMAVRAIDKLIYSMIDTGSPEATMDAPEHQAVNFFNTSILGKRLLGFNPDGSPILGEFPPDYDFSNPTPWPPEPDPDPEEPAPEDPPTP